MKKIALIAYLMLSLNIQAMDTNSTGSILSYFSAYSLMDICKAAAIPTVLWIGGKLYQHGQEPHAQNEQLRLDNQRLQQQTRAQATKNQQPQICFGATTEDVLKIYRTKITKQDAEIAQLMSQNAQLARTKTALEQELNTTAAIARTVSNAYQVQERNTAHYLGILNNQNDTTNFMTLQDRSYTSVSPTDSLASTAAPNNLTHTAPPSGSTSPHNYPVTP